MIYVHTNVRQSGDNTQVLTAKQITNLEKDCMCFIPDWGLECITNYAEAATNTSFFNEAATNYAGTTWKQTQNETVSGSIAKTKPGPIYDLHFNT